MKLLHAIGAMTGHYPQYLSKQVFSPYGWKISTYLRAYYNNEAGCYEIYHIDSIGSPNVLPVIEIHQDYAYLALIDIPIRYELLNRIIRKLFVTEGRRLVEIMYSDSNLYHIDNNGYTRKVAKLMIKRKEVGKLRKAVSDSFSNNPIRQLEEVGILE